MKFKTQISKTDKGRHTIRGYDATMLIKEHSFGEVIFLLLKGRLPNTGEKELLEALLVASVEHGIEAPSAYIPRVVAASGNDAHVALGAGMLAIGSQHGGAAEKAAKIFSSGMSAEETVRDVPIIPGFGHKLYKDEDPRARALFEKAKELGFPCASFSYAYEVEKELAKKKGKKLPLNVDGALACIMLELGLDAKLGKSLFLISRIVGMSAHVLEEMEQNNAYYRLEESDVAVDEL